MATNTRIDPLKKQRASQWEAFLRQYHPSENDVKDYSSWVTWKQRLEPDVRASVSDKLLQFKNDFDELGGYDALAYMRTEEKEHTTSHPTGGHGGAHATSPIKPGDEKKAVDAAEDILRKNKALQPEDTPEQIREREKKAAAEKIIRRFFKENPVNYRRALERKYLPHDPRFTQIAQDRNLEQTTPRGELGDSHTTATSNSARERFFAYHTGALQEYYQKERKEIHQDKREDPMWEASYTSLQEAYAKLTTPTPSYYSDAVSQLGEAQVGAIGRAVYTRQFVEQFPEKAEVYAQQDSSIQQAIQEIEVERIEEEDQDVPELPPLIPPLSIPHYAPREEREEAEERDIARSHTRDERQDAGNQPGAQQTTNSQSSNNNTDGPFSRGKKKARDLAQKGAKKIGNAVGNALKKETKQAIKEGAKQLVQKGLAATSEYWVPVLVVVIIIILLIIFIFMLLGMAGQTAQENSELTETIPVIVSKTVNKAEIKNPSELTDEEKLLTYTISTSYAGKARSLETTEYVPDGTTFASASGTFIAYDNTNTIITDPVKQAGSIKKIVWTTNNVGASGLENAETPAVVVDTYTKPPYLLPSPTQSQESFSEDAISRLNTLGGFVAAHQSYLQAKVKNSDKKYVDPFVSVIWAGAIEGTGGNPYSWNCLDKPGTINEGCSGGFTSGGWQVGYGNQVAQAANHLAADFVEVYKTDSPEKVQEVGNNVIENSTAVKGGKIKNPATFPAETVTSLVTKATAGDIQAQQALAILLMDPEIGAVAIAQEVAKDISANDNWRGTMEGWGPYYVSNMQSFSNKMQTLATTYTAGSQSSARTFTPQIYTLVVKANQEIKDTYIINQATAQAVGVEATTSTQTTIPSTENEAANENNCNGTYAGAISKNPLNKNFGDPSCTLDEVKERDNLYALLKQKDAANADKWFFTIISCESGYNPNAWADPIAVGTPDSGGAWGLFQMGQGKNGEYDHGDVAWGNQVTNAINYNNSLQSINLSFHYWECAKSFWQ